MLSLLARPMRPAAWLTVWVAIATAGAVAAEPSSPVLKIGMIGLDMSHCLEFTKLLNAESPDPPLTGCRVVAVYPQGSPDIESSVSRVPDYTVQIKALGVEVIDDLPAMLARVDAVLLATNDGRPHRAQATAAIEASKPLFIDKPVAGSLADAVAIYELAKARGVPVFSSSSLRFGKAAQAVRGGSIGSVTGCDAWSPCELEPTHPDLFWYGIHGCELLFTALGPGVKTVTRTTTADFEFVTGRRWPCMADQPYGAAVTTAVSDPMTRATWICTVPVRSERHVTVWPKTPAGRPADRAGFARRSGRAHLKPSAREARRSPRRCRRRRSAPPCRPSRRG